MANPFTCKLVHKKASFAVASDERNAPWSLFAAAAVVAAIPIIALFMYLQKYIVSGLTAGGVKG